MKADSEVATAMATIGVALEEMNESEVVGEVEEVEVMDMEGEGLFSPVQQELLLRWNLFGVRLSVD